MNPTDADFLGWDIRSWSRALRYWEKILPEPNENSLALELGGREGGLSLWLASKGYKVVCSDLQDVALTANKLHSRFDPFGRIRYEDIDATNIPYQETFDIVVLKSVLGGVGYNDNLEAQMQVFREVHRALKPGGLFFFAENLKASWLHQFARKKFIRWGSNWRYMSQEEIAMGLKLFHSSNMQSTGFSACFGRNENQRNFLSRLDDIIFNPLALNKHKYIVFGFARKDII
ncbi:MAG: class I SAM-dependent methyltransferase [Flavobacteriales bacterium]